MSAERVIALIVGSLLAAGCVREAVRSFRAGDGVVTTLSTFLAAWSIGLLLFAIPWVRFTRTSTETWLAIYGSIASFTGGCVIARRHAKPPRREDPEAIDARRLRWLWLACLLLGLVGFADFVHAVDLVLGWKALVKDPAAVRDIQTTSAQFRSAYGGLKLLTYFNQIAFLLWTVGVRDRAFSRRWVVAAAFGWVSIVPFVFTGDRTLILTGLLWTLTFHLLWRPVLRPKRLLAGLAVALVVALTLFIALGDRVSKSINMHPEVRAQLTTHTFESLALPYVYVTANFPALSQLMHDPIRPHTYGRMTLLPLAKLLHAAGVGGSPPEEVGAFYPIPFDTFNNYSWLGTFYLDFGLVGCLVLPALLGFVFTRLTSSALRRRHLCGIWLASLALYVVAFSALLNKLSTTLTWEYALLAPIFVVLLRREPTPRAWLVVQRRRIAKLPRLAIAAGLVLAVALVGSAALARVQRRGPATSSMALAGELRVALNRAALTRRRGAFPSARALASRLHVNDPTYLFDPLSSPQQLPADPGVIGVYTNGASLSLRAREGGSVVQLTTGKAVGVRPGHRERHRSVARRPSEA